MKGKEKRKETYRCLNCGWTCIISEEEAALEHCPNCLCGIHDEDREGNECGASEWEIIQRCRFCGEMRATPVTEQDNRIKILSIASKPISSPPFPIERIGEMTKIMGGSGETGGK